MVVLAGSVVLGVVLVVVDDSTGVVDVLGAVLGGVDVGGGSAVWSTESGRPATAMPASSPTMTVATRGSQERFIPLRH